MTGTRDSLVAMIEKLTGTVKVHRRILCSIIPLLFTLPRRINFKQMAIMENTMKGLTITGSPKSLIWKNLTAG
jgi:hypothetical protein